jgi:molecular chaperone HscC
MFAPIIDRRTVIPVSRSKAFRTISDDQPTIEIQVFQGERSMCKDNTPIGRYTVIDLPKRSAGEVAIDVRFTYDLNGILEVETTVQETGDVQAFTIENQPGKLTPEQVQLAREAMKSLKFHPREALPNRTALARAEALFVELRGGRAEPLMAAWRVRWPRAARRAQEPPRAHSFHTRLRAIRNVQSVYW